MASPHFLYLDHQVLPHMVYPGVAQGGEEPLGCTPPFVASLSPAHTPVNSPLVTLDKPAVCYLLGPDMEPGRLWGGHSTLQMLWALPAAGQSGHSNLEVPRPTW